jgi:hypothetical protein
MAKCSGLVLLLLIALLVQPTPARADHQRDCDRTPSGECKVGVAGEAGRRCLRLVRARGGISATINPRTRQFRGGTDGPDNDVVWPSEVYCAFGGDDRVVDAWSDGPGSGAVVYLGGGNDQIDTAGRRTVTYAGAGNDVVESIDEGAIVFGGRGDDAAVVNRGVFVGGKGVDTVLLPESSPGTCIGVENCTL